MMDDNKLGTAVIGQEMQEKLQKQKVTEEIKRT